MGEVWRARHQLLARPCAVKLIRPDRLGAGHRDTALERFRLEARTISRLTSPNTVRLYDFGLSESGSLYFVMELLAASTSSPWSRASARSRPSASSPC